MKAQYRIVAEMLFFMLGVVITSFIIINFHEIQNFFEGVVVEQQMNDISKLAVLGVVKASLSNNSIMVIQIPVEVSDSIYMISVFDENRDECNIGDRCFLDVSNGYTNLSQQLFNISQNHNIIGSVASSAGYMKITTNATHIVIGR